MIDETNRNTALATALVEELARSGVRQAVLSPGSRSSPIALALDREASIELTVVLDERSAGFFALGASLASGAPVAVACTSGSAAANLHPAVVEADQAGVPIVLLTSDRPPELRGIGAGQTIDQIKLYGDAVRWFCEVGTQEADDAGLLHLRAVGCRAVAEARAARGPVHLNLSWRDPLGPEPAGDVTATAPLAIEGRGGTSPLTVAVEDRVPSESTIASLATTIERNPRGLILAGRQTDPELAPVVAELARRAGYPILAEPISQLRLGPHERDLVIAAYDLVLRRPPRSLEPDLVIRFGDMPTSKALRLWLARAEAAEQIVIDPAGRWNEPSRRADRLLRTDAAALAAAVPRRLQRDPDQRWGDGWRAAELRAQSAIDSALADQGGLSEPGILRAIGAELREGEQLMLASSMPIRDGEAFIASSGRAIRVFANRGANGIDGLVSTACGLAAGSGDPTWLVLGDLALAHDIGGLAAISEAGASLHLVVIDNGGGRIFEHLPQAEQVDRQRFDRLFITPTALEIAKVADLFDLDYRPISELGELAGARDSERSLSHLVVDPDRTVELRRRIAATVAEAIGG